MRVHPLLALVPLCLVAADKEDATPLSRLQGKWNIVAMERDGRPAPKAQCASMQITIVGSKMTLAFREGKVPGLVHEIRLDPKNPRIMDLVVIEGSGKGKVLPGIYEFDGKTLKMNHADANAKDRPTEFKSPAGTFHSVVIAERAPK